LGGKKEKQSLLGGEEVGEETTLLRLKGIKRRGEG